MKINSILGVQGFKKILGGVLFVALCVMGLAEAKRTSVTAAQAAAQAAVRQQGNRAGQPVRRGGQPARRGGRTPANPALSPRQPVAPQGQAVVQQPVLPPQTQSDQNQVLQNRVLLLISQPFSSEINRELETLWPHFSDEQKKLITNYLNTQKQLYAMQNQIDQLKKAGMREAVLPIEQVKIEKPAEKGWLSSWFGYEPSQLTPVQNMAAGAAGVVIAGAAALTAGVWGPALASAAAYIGVKGALGLAGTAYTVSTIKFALKTGAATTAGAITLRKIELSKVLEGGRYPAFELQLEALRDKWRAELLAPGEDLNDSIFVSACVEMADDIKKLSEKRTDKELETARLIIQAVNQCREESNSQRATPQQYINNIEIALRNRTIDTPEKLSAYNSELERAKKRIDLEVAQHEARKQAEKEAEALKEKAQEAASVATEAAKTIWSNLPSGY